jgi:hypothetical protein
MLYKLHHHLREHRAFQAWLIQHRTKVWATDHASEQASLAACCPVRLTNRAPHITSMS